MCKRMWKGGSRPSEAMQQPRAAEKEKQEMTDSPYEKEKKHLLPRSTSIIRYNLRGAHTCYYITPL